MKGVDSVTNGHRASSRGYDRRAESCFVGALPPDHGTERLRVAIVLRCGTPRGDSDRAACRTNDTEPGQNAWISWCAGAGTDATIPSRLSMLPTRTEAGLSLPRCCAADKACTASRSKASEPTAYRVSVGKTIRRPERSASPAWESPCCLASGTRQFSGWSPSRAHRR